MASSYERINYSLRPAKQIERKMLVEAFRKLAEFGALDSYRYIGFGSIYFSDFSLVHKALGIPEMISIEKDEDVKERFLFNRPFGCIEMRFGHATKILPNLSWDQRTILWLDYDGTLTADVLSDIDIFITNAAPGSVIVVTVNAEPAPRRLPKRSSEVRQALEGAVRDLRRRIGENKVPKDVDGRSLRKWGTAKLYRRIINNQILETLSVRNGARSKGNKLLFQQLFNFHYADGMKMLTVGGIVFDQGQEGTLAKCMFERLDFVKEGEGEYKIEVPKLTYRELHHLDKQLPEKDMTQLEMSGIPEADCERYSQVYRFFPTFAETEF